MLDALMALFDTDGFPARWNCGTWTELHGWTHVVADLLIFGAYGAIPITIAYFVVKRRSVHFPGLYALFGAFIFSCGLGHLVDATLFWNPWYRFYAAVKIVTAVASWATVIALVRLVPKALELPQIARLNDRLKVEVAERARAEEEVKRLNAVLRGRVEELETLLDVIPVGIGIATDPECRTIRTNPAFARQLRMTPTQNASLSSPDSAPTHFKVFHRGELLHPEQLPIQLAARHGESLRDFEEEIVFSDDSRITLLASAEPLRDGSGNPRGAVGTFVDITALKAMERERAAVQRRLLEAQKLESLGVLAGGVAHDFNNLLVGVLGNASLLSTQLEESPRLRELSTSIERSAMRAADLCRQMLAYSGRGRFVVELVDMSSIVADTLSLLRANIPSRCEVRLDLASNLPPVLGDATQARQVVMNLVINAAEAIGDRRGTIRCRTRIVDAAREKLDLAIGGDAVEPGRFVEVSVTDDGCGMDEETRARMFEPFYSTKFAGRGLGMAATLGILRGHGGAIEVVSSPGKGTSIAVLWPVATKPGAIETAPSEPGAREDEPRGEGELLVVDDEGAVREVVRLMLEKLGFTVATTGIGRDALTWIEREPERFRLAIVDLTMPGMDGEELCRGIRRLSPKLPIILISGFDEGRSLERFEDLTLAGFLQKPFHADALSRRVLEVLGRVRGERVGDPASS